MLTFSKIPDRYELIPLKANDDMMLYESFILSNPLTSNSFPLNDEPYYRALEYQLKHLLYKYEKGWIESERQVIYTSNECISAVHFIFDNHKKVIGINVFQRSSNILNLEDDCQFFNYFISKYCDAEEVNLSIFVSMPHILNGRVKKVED